MELDFTANKVLHAAKFFNHSLWLGLQELLQRMTQERARVAEQAEKERLAKVARQAEGATRNASLTPELAAEAPGEVHVGQKRSADRIADEDGRSRAARSLASAERSHQCRSS